LASSSPTISINFFGNGLAQDAKPLIIEGKSMVKVTFIQLDGNAATVDAELGQSVMEIAVEEGIENIIGECGGTMSCGTCHCYVDNNWLDKLESPSELELAILEGSVEPNKNSRLSCQIRLSGALNGLIVSVPRAQC
jgi:2Fe-2S ferredoxin